CVVCVCVGMRVSLCVWRNHIKVVSARPLCVGPWSSHLCRQGEGQKKAQDEALSMGYEWADGGLRSPKEQGHSTLVQGEPPGVRASWILRIRSLSLTHSSLSLSPPLMPL